MDWKWCQPGLISLMMRVRFPPAQPSFEVCVKYDYKYDDHDEIILAKKRLKKGRSVSTWHENFSSKQASIGNQTKDIHTGYSVSSHEYCVSWLSDEVDGRSYEAGK